MGRGNVLVSVSDRKLVKPYDSDPILNNFRKDAIQKDFNETLSNRSVSVGQLNKVSTNIDNGRVNGEAQMFND